MTSHMRSSLRRWAGWALVGVLVAVAAVTWPRWRPFLEIWPGRGDHSAAPHEHGATAAGEHAEAADVLQLSPQALQNLGLTPEYVRPIRLEDYHRSIAVPAIVVDQPGRTHLPVASAMTGVITHVHATLGEAVLPGTLLFEIRLTHEDLVTAQVDFLKALGELDVEIKEIVRLKAVAESGAISTRTLLDREYARDKLEALIAAEREALRIHGLSERQVQHIETERKLLRDLQVLAPGPDEHEHDGELQLTGERDSPVMFQPGPAKDAIPLTVHELSVHKGDSVEAGASLCVLANYEELYIEGLAFEQDAAAVVRSIDQGWPVTAHFEGAPDAPPAGPLKIAYVASDIDAESRALKFYVTLPNEIIRDAVDDRGRRFVVWRYRTGQRLQLRVTVEKLSGQIVLPVEAVAREGAESYVFREHGNHFERVPVHVALRDQSHVVIARDGAVRAGDVVALRSAHQMQMALKNKSGGGVDPHAGHTH